MRELYPPILPSYIPAFDYGEANAGSVRIYFQLSHYNTISQVSQAQVAIRFQTNNASALADRFYNEVFTASIELADETNTEYPYYILVPGTYLKNGFQPGYIYKAQIRLSSTTTTDESPTAAYINANLNNFSEWSTVCILKSIIKPTGGIREFITDYDDENAEEVVLTTAASDATFYGFYTLAEDSDETPLSWRMRLYHYNTTISTFDLIGDSGEVIFNAYDFIGSSDDNTVPFECDFQTQLDNGQRYKIILNIMSKNGYSIDKEYTFDAVQSLNTDFYPDVIAAIDEEDAFAKVSILELSKNVSLILTLRRTSSKSNYNKWEDLTNFNIRNEKVDVTFYDYAIESGVVYQYAVQVRDNNHRRGILIKSNKIMGEFNYAYLLEHSQGFNNVPVQLRLAYNVVINSFATTVVEARTETIGSQYPFIVRNGNTYYKTFQLSGLISYHMDEASLFTSRSRTYQDAKEYFDQFNENRKNLEASLMKHDTEKKDTNNFLPYIEEYDYTYERDFREQVMTFLYNTKPKLFKSASEGNILVRLMEVSLVPKQELGRLIYDFSATAYEIGEPSLENLNFYGIQTIEPYAIDLIYNNKYIGQLNSFDFNFYDGIDINKEIRSKHHLNGDAGGDVFDGVRYLSGALRYLKITFESPPYLIDKRTMTPAPMEEVPSEYAVMGWLILYGTLPILITYPNNIYEFKDDNVIIQYGTSIVFPIAVQATVDYVIEIAQEPASAGIIVARQEFQRKIGQLYGVFQSKENFINNILYKYFLDLKDYYQQVNVINYIDIEANPGTVVYLRENVDDEDKRFVINFTGRLYFEPEEGGVTFKKGYFYGVNIPASQLNRDFGNVTALPENPLPFDYCILDSAYYVYHKKDWREAIYISNDNSYDIACPIEGIVNYYVQTVKGIYG